MSPSVPVRVHSSQFPDAVRRDLLESIRRRQINHKFHYDSIKQTQKWLALHETYSPARTDADCLEVYARSFKAAASQIFAPQIHLIGLGCGGGQKDAQCLTFLKEQGKTIAYTPVDVSVAMVLVAHQTTVKIIPADHCFPIVCDLASEDDLREIVEKNPDDKSARLLTFFGMIPNFEPSNILPKISGLLHGGDWMLLSANLAPGKDYVAGIKQILPLYENELTRDWLQTFLSDLGVEKQDGHIRFMIEDCPDESGLKRIAAYFIFATEKTISVSGEQFQFKAGDQIRLFFSYRYTPTLLKKLLADHGIAVVQQWSTDSGEEGVFLCRKPS